MMKHSKDYSSIDWEKIVEYSEESKTGLRYVISKETAQIKHKGGTMDQKTIKPFLASELRCTKPIEALHE